MNRILKLYFMLPSDNSLGLFTKIVNRLSSRIVKILFDFFIIKKESKLPRIKKLGLEKRNQRIIISITTFNERFDVVWVVIESMLKQSFKADKIVLWLSKDLISKKLPSKLIEQKGYGLEFRYVEDLRAHTKYYYALQEFSEDIVITVDDDCYYPLDLIENLVNLHNEYANSIIANRVHGMTFNNEGKLGLYENWKHNYKTSNYDEIPLFLTGVGGVLYPPNSFNKDLFEKNIFGQICKYADDVWLTINAYRSGTSIKTNDKFNKDFISISKSSKVRLLNHNSKSGGNDKQLRAVLNHFKINNLMVFIKNQAKV